MNIQEFRALRGFFNLIFKQEGRLVLKAPNILHGQPIRFQVAERV